MKRQLSPQSGAPPADKGSRRARRAKARDAVEVAYARAAAAAWAGDCKGVEAWAKAVRSLEDAERRSGLHRREEARIAAQRAALKAAEDALRDTARREHEELLDERAKLARIARALQKGVDA